MRYQLPKDDSSFWKQRMTMVADRMVPYQQAVLEDKASDAEPSHAIENFRIAAGLSQGEYYGMVFQDSDVGKWIEAAAYTLMLKPDPALECKIDEIVDIVAAAQQPDGYLNTYYTLKEPGKRWTNVGECHEMYCAGHLLEGAIAYYTATGKRTFLDVMCRMADHIGSIFGPEAGQKRGYPGHPELELALMRLYAVTQERRYADLATFFINERGQKPLYFLQESEQEGFKSSWGYIHKHPEYGQSHLPLREQSDAIGHAVRALYLYAGMVDVAAYTGDEELMAACHRLWQSAAERQRYITGAYGAQDLGEAFSIDYELPNDTVYGETCASVAMIFFSQRMLKIHRDRKYADVIENALFNTLLAGTQLDGSRFFYCNPLEAVRGVSGVLPEYRSLLIDRPGWFACACCPPNLARTVASLPQYAYEEGEGTVTVHQYLAGAVHLDTAGGVTLTHANQYPWNGALHFTVQPDAPGAAFQLRVRVPGWCRSHTLQVDGAPVEAPLDAYGYVVIDRAWAAETQVTLTLALQPERCYASTKVREDAGCVALMRGPLVYCAESVDNGGELHNLRIPRGAEITVQPYDANLLSGVCTMKVQGARMQAADGQLYSFDPPVRQEAEITLIPYYAWSNRGTEDMRVWLLEG